DDDGRTLVFGPPHAADERAGGRVGREGGGGVQGEYHFASCPRAARCPLAFPSPTQRERVASSEAASRERALTRSAPLPPRTCGPRHPLPASRGEGKKVQANSPRTPRGRTSPSN